MCSPARACLYTGNHSFRHKVYVPGDTLAHSTDSDTTIAKVLKAHGYATALFGKWHLSGGGESGCAPLNKQPIPSGAIDFGWDKYSGAFYGQVENYTNWSRTIETAGEKPTCVQQNRYAPLANKDQAKAWITQQGSAKWMAIVAFNAPHKPWDEQARDSYGSRAYDSTRARYRSMLESIDRYMGELLDELDASVIDNTTIIFIGDNGTPEEINDHYADGQCKGSIYEGGINIAIIARWLRIPARSRIHNEHNGTRGITRQDCRARDQRAGFVCHVCCDWGCYR